jgi:hypothetical protein
MAAEDYHDMDQMFDPEYTMQFDEYYRPKRTWWNDYDHYLKGLKKMQVTKAVDSMPPNKVKREKIKKFYVAAAHISQNIAKGTNSDWCHEKLEDAVGQAEIILTRDPHTELVAICKIIRVVRRPKPKFIVEEVK